MLARGHESFGAPLLVHLGLHINISSELHLTKQFLRTFWDKVDMYVSLLTAKLLKKL